jgi:gustatory receptor
MDVSDLADLYGNELHISQIAKWVRGSARARDIAKRAQLDSADGQVIDEHDQFFRDHKLLLVLFRVSPRSCVACRNPSPKVLGVMPVQRGQIGRITFSWTSIPMLYAYVFYVVTSVLVVLVGYERFDILLNKSKKFDEYIYSIIFIIYLIPHFWVPFVGWGVAYEVCDYKNSWGTFQLHYYKITGPSFDLDGTPLIFSLQARIFNSRF